MKIKDIKLSKIFTFQNVLTAAGLACGLALAADQIDDSRTLSVCEGAEQIHRLAGRIEYNAERGGIHPYAFETMQKALEISAQPECRPRF